MRLFRHLLTFKGIARDDAEGRHQHRRDNFLFYGAPVELIFHLPAAAAAGTFLDLGFFMQNVILGLESYGLASCPQYSVASYSDIVRHHLGLGTDRTIVSGLAVGYPDPTSRLNTFVPDRAATETFKQWYGWGAESAADDDAPDGWAAGVADTPPAETAEMVQV